MTKQLLKQRFFLSVKGKIEAMDRLAIIQGQTIVEATVGVSRKRID